jgi:hypothetical protein
VHVRWFTPVRRIEEYSVRTITENRRHRA